MWNHKLRRIVAGWMGIAAISWLAESTFGADVQAVTGRPFGVARVSLPLSPASDSLAVETNGHQIEDPEGRVLYPVFGHRRVLGLVREILGVPGNDVPSSVTAYFLFRGDAPFQITMWTPEPEVIVVSPQPNPRLAQRLQRSWWQQYTAVARLQQRHSDYPPMIESYLTAMLGRRLGLQTPFAQRLPRAKQDVAQESLLLVLNVESMRIQAMEETLRGECDLGVASLPVPDPLAWAETAAAVQAEIPVEPLAARVPEDCFYLRFGSFDNYLWLNRFLEQNGGSAGQLVTLRGHDPMLTQRTQDQLGLQESTLAELLGNQLISDVALIGRDTYLREGAAIGIVFEARNGLLRGELMKQRRAAAQRFKDQGATVEEIQFGDVTASSASTPDNRLRSFLVSRDNYHLVTNSRRLAERFAGLQSDRESLAASPAFRQARQAFPEDRKATAFAYLSPAFFRGLVSPQYQIELRRRLRAVTDLELVQLAQLAAIREGLPHERLDDLIAARLLPPEFARRADGSRVLLGGSEPMDSLRGVRGSFLPIPDVSLEGVTPREAARFAEISAFHRTNWTEMDPLIVHIERVPLAAAGREQIVIEAEMLPFDRQKYGMATALLGPATRTRIRQSPDDAITAQLVLQGGPLRPDAGPHHLFFGIQDEEIPIEFSEEMLSRVLQVLRTAPAYLGAWPKTGLLDLLPLGRRPTANAAGISQLPFGLWRIETPAGFSLIGTDPQRLSQVTRELRVEEAETEAQVRIHIADVSQAKIKTWFAALDFQRAYQTSVGNTRLMHALIQQLGVAPEDALAVAQRTLGVELICPLGGDYQLREDPYGQRYWASTNWPQLRNDPSLPGQFASPSMAWFRGLDAEVKMLDDHVTARAVMEIEQPAQGKPKLPFFDFFKR